MFFLAQSRRPSFRSPESAVLGGPKLTSALLKRNCLDQATSTVHGKEPCKQLCKNGQLTLGIFMAGEYSESTGS